MPRNPRTNQARSIRPRRLRRHALVGGVSALMVLAAAWTTQALGAQAARTGLVGSLAGEFSVEQGAVSYRIPIDVSPGVAGMSPDLAIVYSSPAGNGSLGQGFSVEGKGSYGYDASGNLTSGGGRTLSWSSYNKPTLISANGHTLAFAYGPARARYRKVEDFGARTTYYRGAYYERVEKDSEIEHRHQIIAAGRIVAVHVQYPGGAEDTRYLHHDALGSVDTITDADGHVIERLSYDPFG